MATETQAASTPDAVTQLISEMKSQNSTIAEIQGAVKSLTEKLDAPDYSRVHIGDQAVGLWGTENDTQYIKTRVRKDGSCRTLPKGLPKGYKNEVFKTAGQYYRELIDCTKANNLSPFYAKLESVTKAIQGMNTQVAADGGAWILPEFSNTLIDRVFSNDLWQRTDGYTVTGNNLTFKANAETSRVNGQRHGGLRGYWTAEGAAGTKSKPTTRDVMLKLNKLMILVYLTDDVMEDAGPALEQFVNAKASQEFEFLLGDAVFNGNGVGMPLGILNAGALLSVTKETGQLAATIVTENIDKMWARRHSGGDYAWYHNQDCGPQLDRLEQSVGTGGLPLNRPNGIGGVMYQTLKTAPRIETEFNATVGTVGDIVLADLGKYLTITKGGITQAASMHVEFVTDQTALRFTLRVDGRPADVAPLTPYKGSNTQSSLVALATRS